MSKMQEDFQEFVDSFQKAKTGGGSNVNEILQKNQLFFDSLRLAFEQGSAQERGEALRLLRLSFEVLAREGKEHALLGGIPEEELQKGSKASFLSEEQKKTLEALEERVKKINKELS